MAEQLAMFFHREAVGHTGDIIRDNARMRHLVRRAARLVHAHLPVIGQQLVIVGKGFIQILHDLADLQSHAVDLVMVIHAGTQEHAQCLDIGEHRIGKRNDLAACRTDIVRRLRL